MERFLIASHGTPGARAAEEAAFDRCGKGGVLHHLVVVPEFWKGMLGDDWLNNAVTRARFGRYVECQLEREIAEDSARLADEAARRGVAYSHEFRLGKPADCVLASARAADFALVVIGSPRPPRAPGYRSRMDVAVLVRGLKAPLLIVPHPAR